MDQSNGHANEGAGGTGDSLVGADVIAQRLGVHPVTVRRMADSRLIPSVRVGGGAIRFDVDAVMNAVRRNGSIPAIGDSGGTPARRMIPRRDTDDDERTAALKAVLGTIAGEIERGKEMELFYQIPDILATAEKQGVAGILTLGNPSPARSLGKALAKLRGRLLKDSQGRPFEIIREIKNGSPIYLIRF